jgi:glycosyltransferase involved in cell wall biosynthesis
MGMSMRVLHVSTYDGNSGAARAAHSLHSALRSIDVDSQMLVASSSSGDPTVSGLKLSTNLRWRVSQRMDRSLWDLQKSQNTSWRSPAHFGVLNARLINQSSADVVNLHWITNGFLSIKQIGMIEKPIVWSMYDMWTFCGTEHYGRDTPDARWRSGYSHTNRLTGETGLDIDRIAWAKKMKYWNRRMHMAPASSWLEDRVCASAIGSLLEWEVTRISHVIDTTVFSPMDKIATRAEFSLPSGAPLIVFLASGGVQDQRKGWDLLDDALTQLRPIVPNVEVVIAGPTPSGFRTSSGTPVHLVGEVVGSEKLRALYAAANVVAVPSREDTMPLTAMEAQACGAPVVAFRIGGLPDIVDHQVTGYLAEPFDPGDLAAGLAAMLVGTETPVAERARDRAVRLWSPNVVAGRYTELYQTAIAAAQGK